MSPAENVQRQRMAMHLWNGTYDRLPNITQPIFLITGDDDAITRQRILLSSANASRLPWLCRCGGRAWSDEPVTGDDFKHRSDAFERGELKWGCRRALLADPDTHRHIEAMFGACCGLTGQVQRS